MMRILVNLSSTGEMILTPLTLADGIRHQVDLKLILPFSTHLMSTHLVVTWSLKWSQWIIMTIIILSTMDMKTTVSTSLNTTMLTTTLEIMAITMIGTLDTIMLITHLPTMMFITTLISVITLTQLTMLVMDITSTLMVLRLISELHMMLMHQCTQLTLLSMMFMLHHMLLLIQLHITNQYTMHHFTPLLTTLKPMLQYMLQCML